MQIYVARNGEKQGPYDVDAVQKAIDEGKILGTDMAWYEGAPDWVAVSQIPGLRLPTIIAPPLPPVVPAQSNFPPSHTPQVAPAAPAAPEVGCGGQLVAVLLCLAALYCISYVLGNMSGIVTLLLVVGTSVWVLVDASAIGVKRGQIKGLSDMSAVGWLFACLLVWIIGFPLYIVARPQFKKINGKA